MPLTPAHNPPTFVTVLIRGLLAGLVAGLLAGGFGYLVGEPRIDAAIAIEEAATHTGPVADDHHGDDLVGRDGQRFGLFLATGLFGTAMGGLLATAFVLLRRRFPAAADDGRSALLLAGGALLGVVLVPFGKYPANPPAVGNPDTIDQRTVAYLALVVLGLVAVWAGTLGYRSVRADAPPWQRHGAALGGFALVAGVGYVVLPSFQEVPDDFPATLLWNFRLASLGTQVVLWVAIGLLFSALMSPRPAGPRPDDRAAEPLTGQGTPARP
ncbi:CbtA family protein [Micromonospora humida]|uniref:CbtA family protein n=1 Tax=Micromonospora humida TaxID=2809018 RepID=A0ABS2IQ23_9ACTN|nr:CbtA family protein [Micromonospora humida]MBM7076427.1 CbtA family protein [Micromonospora humida]